MQENGQPAAPDEREEAQAPLERPAPDGENAPEARTEEKAESGAQTAAEEEVSLLETEEDEENLPQPKKLFTLDFHLPLEEYLEFYRIMNMENAVKGKKKMTVMGAVEILIGVVLLGTSVAGITAASPLSWVLLAVIFLLGLRSLFYYRFFYDKALAKAVTKEYNKLPYLREKMKIDFYPNKCVEHVNGQRVETFWHGIHSVKESANLYMIMLEARRCLLVPKSQIAQQMPQMERLVRDICENFEKPRYEV